jgi:AGZA family xanthine/uracil permease-like MFS transporter
MQRYAWAAWGDVNAFFGLMLDNVAVMVLFVSLIAGDSSGQYTPQFVLTHMIPGTALGVLLGDLVYTAMAFRLARRTGRGEVTAMPLGLDTPSTFGTAFLVMLPALAEGNRLFPADHDRAMLFGWHVGVAVLVLVGLFKVACAPLGNAVRRWVPRAGLLGSLAAIALALIAFVPLLLDIASVPIAGLAVLTVILITLVAHRALPYKVPGALAAVILGVFLVFGGRALGQLMGAPLVPGAGGGGEGALSLPSLSPFTTLEAGWWRDVLMAALARMPLALPFALATIVGGIDCTESAAAAGDEYDTRAVLLTEGVASVAAGLLGGVIQTTPYIGHPAYKAMGGRAAYTLATALFVGAVGCFGVFGMLFAFLPPVAMFPILVFVGLEITAQSFHATPVKHYAALAFGFLPTLAYLATIPVGAALGGIEVAPGDRAIVVLTTLRCLANGFIVTSLLWAAALAAILDGKLRGAAAYLLVAAACALFSVIHSPFSDIPLRPRPGEAAEAREVPVARIERPWRVLEEMPDRPDVRCQSPYHWAAGYVLSAAVLVGLSFLRAGRNGALPDDRQS